jgi:hypothetical protein
VGDGTASAGMAGFHLEEVFTTLTRYWRFDDLAPCRQGVAYALIHFALLAYTLLGFHLQETDADEDALTWNLALPPIPIPERELAVYAGFHLALLLPSELWEIILSLIWMPGKPTVIACSRPCAFVRAISKIGPGCYLI